MKISEYNETIGFFSSVLMVTKFECDIGTNPCAEIELPHEYTVAYTINNSYEVKEEYVPLSWYFTNRFRTINPIGGFITDIGV